MEVELTWFYNLETTMETRIDLHHPRGDLLPKRERPPNLLNMRMRRKFSVNLSVTLPV